MIEKVPNPVRRFPVRDPQRGTVLIVVLWASLGLVSVALLFGHSMLMGYRGSDNDLAGRQADQAIEGAARYAEAILTSSTATPGVLPDISTYETEAVPVGEATFWFIGRTLDTTGVTANGRTRTYGLIDEASKINLNTASNAMLMSLPGMTTDLAQAIQDWRASATNAGSSSGTASTSTASSVNKQAPFESVEELALVSASTRDILFGEDANLNGVLEANEDDSNANLPADNADGKLDPGIFEYVTVFSRESNFQKDGKTKRIDIKDPNSGFEDYVEKAFPSKSAADRQLVVAAASNPTVTNLLSFYLDSGLTEAEFGQIAYELTTPEQQQLVLSTDSQKQFLCGLINVNTASEVVLATIFDSSQAAAIVSARASRTQPDTSYTWVATALGLKANTPPAAALNTALNRITGKCSQVTADIAAVGRHGRGWRRTRMVIDISGTTPRIVYRRNLAPLGWALGSDVRTQLAQTKEAQ